MLGVPSILVNNVAHSTRDGFENLDSTTLAYSTRSYR